MVSFAAKRELTQRKFRRIYALFALGALAVGGGGYKLYPLFKNTELPPLYETGASNRLTCPQRKDVLGIVFTGVDDRTLAALMLYLSGEIGRLLITGKDLTQTAEELLELFGLPKGRPLDGIMFDRNPNNTGGGKENIRELLQKSNPAIVVIITSAQHIPRTVDLLRSIEHLPSLRIYPLPGSEDAGDKVSEFVKGIATRAGWTYIGDHQIGRLPLSGLVPSPVVDLISPSIPSVNPKLVSIRDNPLIAEAVCE